MLYCSALCVCVCSAAYRRLMLLPFGWVYMEHFYIIILHIEIILVPNSNTDQRLRISLSLCTSSLSSTSSSSVVLFTFRFIICSFFYDSFCVVPFLVSISSGERRVCARELYLRILFLLFIDDDWLSVNTWPFRALPIYFYARIWFTLYTTSEPSNNAIKYEFVWLLRIKYYFCVRAERTQFLFVAFHIIFLLCRVRGKFNI